MFLARLSSKRLKPLAPRPTVSLLIVLVLYQKQIWSGISKDCFTDVLILHLGMFSFQLTHYILGGVLLHVYINIS